MRTMMPLLVLCMLSCGVSGCSGQSDDDTESGDDDVSAAGDDDSTGSNGDDDSTGSTGDDDSTGSTGDDDSTGSTGDDDTTGTTGDDDATGGSGDDDASQPSPTEPPGPIPAETLTIISQNTVWKKADGDVALTGDLYIPPGVTLTIEPGVLVKLYPEVDLYVEGVIDAHASADAHVLFTRGAVTFRWGRIYLAGKTPSRFDGAWIEGGMVDFYSEGRLDDATLLNTGVQVEPGVNATFDGCILATDGSDDASLVGVNALAGSTTVISNSQLTGYYRGMSIVGNSQDACNLELDNVSVTASISYGLYLSYTDIQATGLEVSEGLSDGILPTSFNVTGNIVASSISHNARNGFGANSAGGTTPLALNLESSDVVGNSSLGAINLGVVSNCYVADNNGQTGLDQVSVAGTADGVADARSAQISYADAILEPRTTPNL